MCTVRAGDRHRGAVLLESHVVVEVIYGRTTHSDCIRDGCPDRGRFNLSDLPEVPGSCGGIKTGYHRRGREGFGSGSSGDASGSHDRRLAR